MAISSNVLRQLLKNPHYKMSRDQQALVQTPDDVRLTTQEIRTDDDNVKAPKTRRKKRNARRKSMSDTVSETDVRQEVQEISDLS